MDRMKVSIIEPVGGHGGLDFYDLGLCEALSRQQIDVTLYTCNKLKIHENYPHKFRIVFSYTNTYSYKSKLIKGIKFFKGTISALIDSKKMRSTIAHFHIFHFAYREFFNILLFKVLGFKIIATIHDVESLDKIKKKQNRLKYKKFSKLVDQVIVHNSFTRKELIKTNQGFSKDTIKIVPPTDLDFLFNKDIKRSEAREALDIRLPEDSRIVLFFGQIKKTKGLDILIKAFAQLKKKNIFLVIAGRCWKTDMNSYRTLISKLNLEKKTILIEKYIENRDVMLLFKAANIAVLPYLKVYNSSVLLRGMDYGTVNVVSDLDFFTEIIIDGFNGLIFKNGDVNDLKVVMSGIIDDDKQIKRISENSEKFVQQNYSFNVTGKKLRSIYESLLQVNK